MQKSRWSNPSRNLLPTTLCLWQRSSDRKPKKQIVRLSIASASIAPGVFEIQLRSAEAAEGGVELLSPATLGWSGLLRAGCKPLSEVQQTTFGVGLVHEIGPLVSLYDEVCVLIAGSNNA